MRTSLCFGALAATLAACPHVYGPASCTDNVPAFSNIAIDPAMPPRATEPVFDVRYTATTHAFGVLTDDSYDGGVPDSLSAAQTPLRTVELIEAGRLRFTLKAPLGRGTSFTVRYPDRRYFSSCSGSGTSDLVWLTIDVFGNGADGGYAVSTTETTAPGPI